MNKEKFLSAKLENISLVYSGKRNCCRCGCGGEYTATSYSLTDLQDVNDKLIEKRLNRVKKLIEAGNVDVDFGDNYVDIETGNNRTLTFYFDDVAVSLI